MPARVRRGSPGVPGRQAARDGPRRADPEQTLLGAPKRRRAEGQNGGTVAERDRAPERPVRTGAVGLLHLSLFRVPGPRVCRGGTRMSRSRGSAQRRTIVGTRNGPRGADRVPSREVHVVVIEPRVRAHPQAFAGPSLWRRPIRRPSSLSVRRQARNARPKAQDDRRVPPASFRPSARAKREARIPRPKGAHEGRNAREMGRGAKNDGSLAGGAELLLSR